MKILLSVFLVISSFTNSQAAIPIVPDTSHKPWRINQKQFLDRSGKDDTSRALIKYWFYNRTTGWMITPLAGLAASIFGAGFIYALSRGDGVATLGLGIFAIP